MKNNLSTQSTSSTKSNLSIEEFLVHRIYYGKVHTMYLHSYDNVTCMFYQYHSMNSGDVFKFAFGENNVNIPGYYGNLHNILNYIKTVPTNKKLLNELINLYPEYII